MLLIESGGRSFSDPWLCVFLVPQEVFDPSHKPTRPSCSLDVQTVVISRFNRHSNVMVTRASTTPAIYRENLGGMKALTTVRGGWCHAWVSASKAACFPHQREADPRRIHLEVSGRGNRHRRAQHVQSMNEKVLEESSREMLGRVVGGEEGQGWMDGGSSREMDDVLEGGMGELIGEWVEERKQIEQR